MKNEMSMDKINDLIEKSLRETYDIAYKEGVDAMARSFECTLDTLEMNINNRKMSDEGFRKFTETVTNIMRINIKRYRNK